MPWKRPTAHPAEPKLLVRLRHKLRLERYSIRTEQIYVDWCAQGRAAPGGKLKLLASAQIAPAASLNIRAADISLRRNKLCSPHRAACRVVSRKTRGFALYREVLDAKRSSCLLLRRRKRLGVCRSFRPNAKPRRSNYRCATRLSTFQCLRALKAGSGSRSGAGAYTALAVSYACSAPIKAAAGSPAIR